MRRTVLAMLGISILIAGVLSWFASTLPDGLERVALDRGFFSKAVEPLYKLFPDYTLPGDMNEFLSRGLAGVIGTLIVFGAVLGLGKVITRNRKPED